MDRKRVLILYGPPGMGHLKIAKAIEEAFFKKYPEIKVKSVDISEYSNYFLKNYASLYNSIVKNNPALFKWAFEYFENKKSQGFLNKIFFYFDSKKKNFISFINDFHPDFIISTNPLPLQVVSLIKQKHLTDIFSANVCTDYGPHSYWHNEDANYYFVANDKIKNYFIEKHVPENNIKITGIPVAQKFKNLKDTKKIINSLHFSDKYPILLIVGGQFKYKEFLDVILGIKNKNKNAQFIFVAGRDKELQKDIKTSILRSDPSVKLFGFTDKIDEFMAVSSLILSKAGGSTMAECMAMGLPMIINKTIPGQEEQNVGYLLENKAGVKADNLDELVEIIIDLFSNKEKLAEMKKNCKKIAKPNAANEIADFIASKITKK